MNCGDLTETQVTNLESILTQDAIVSHSLALVLLRWNNPEYAFTELILEKQASGARKTWKDIVIMNYIFRYGRNKT